MNIIDAVNAAVHDHQGSRGASRPNVGISADALHGRVNPGEGVRHLDMAEAELILLELLARQHGFHLVKAPDAGGKGSGMDALEQALVRGGTRGERTGASHAAQGTGWIGEKELRASRAAERALQAVSARVAQCAERLDRQDGRAERET